MPETFLIMSTTQSSAEKKATDQKPSTVSIADQLADIDRQMEALQARKLSLNQSAIHEQKLKIADIRKQLAEEEGKLDILTGRPASALRKPRRARTPSITDEALKGQVIKVMAEHGKEGMNAIQLAERLNQSPIRVRKYIKENPKALKRQGNGPGTKFFLP